MDAWKLFSDYRCKPIKNEDDDFVIEEILNCLVEEQDAVGIFNLASHYYDCENYELALRYFEMAAELGDTHSLTYIGDIWHYGYTGTVDYEKAFLCYSSNADHNTLSKIRIADMYRDGCYVEKDYDKYCSIIEELYSRYVQGSYLFIAVPDILFRMAGILKHRGNQAQAILLLKEAKTWLDENMADIPRPEELHLMQEVVIELYSITDVDEIDLFDCFYVLQTPKTVTFSFNGKEYDIQSVQEEERISVFFEGTWYRTIEDFVRKAVIEENSITAIRNELCDFKVKEYGYH